MDSFASSSSDLLEAACCIHDLGSSAGGHLDFVGELEDWCVTKRVRHTQPGMSSGGVQLGEGASAGGGTRGGVQAQPPASEKKPTQICASAAPRAGTQLQPDALAALSLQLQQAQQQQQSAEAALLAASSAQRRAASSFAPQQHPSQLPQAHLLASMGGVDPSLLLAALAAQERAQQQQQAGVGASPTQGVSPEAVWQQVAASGADNQSLLALAASLGLISSDAAGNLQVAPGSSDCLANPSAPQLQHSTMFSDSILAAGGSGLGGLAPLRRDASSAAHSQQLHSVSAPLPQIPASALAGLLASLDVTGSGVLDSTSMTGGGARALGSPGSGGPGPAKQHTLYKVRCNIKHSVVLTTRLFADQGAAAADFKSRIVCREISGG
jgi:hypothetical protein